MWRLASLRRVGCLLAVAALAVGGPAPSARAETKATGPKAAGSKRATTATATTGAAEAAAVRARLERLLESNPRIGVATSGQDAADAGLARARAGWFPDLTVSAGAGREIQRSPTSGHTNASRREADVLLRQPLLDFGRIGGEIEKARLARRQADATVIDARQGLLLDGLSAIVNIVRTRQVVEYSKRSLSNIERQTGMEESRVDIGGGYATDVLQAKSQLAGARARLSRAEGAWVNALNHYRALFQETPPTTLAEVKLTRDAVPTSLDTIIDLARANNPQLQVASLGADIARAEVVRVRGAELMPRVDAVADLSTKHNVDGTLGNVHDQTYKVTVTMPFNLGLAPLHSIDAAQATARGAALQLDNQRLLIDEQVANAWQNLLTARETAGFFDNQTHIADAFLRLAREERQQGRRSLLDVLSGETSLFNAQADAAFAAADLTIAALTLLRTAGILDLSVLP